jgi:hypothetical protein
VIITKSWFAEARVPHSYEREKFLAELDAALAAVADAENAKGRKLADFQAPARKMDKPFSF